MDRSPRAAQRSRAFRAAGRHSSRVVFLRRAILLGAVTGAGALLWIGIFKPFTTVVPDVSIKGANLDGTRVTMEQPRLSGYRKDGRPYEVRAASGVQDIRQPNLVELRDIDAKISMLDQSTLTVASPDGLYDSTREFMDFKSAVRIRSASYDIDMKSAQMDFKAGTVVTDKAVKVMISAGEIMADSMNVRNSGQDITFEGNVRSTFEPADDALSKGEAK